MPQNETIFSSSAEMLGMLQKDNSIIIILLWLSHIILCDSQQVGFIALSLWKFNDSFLGYVPSLAQLRRTKMIVIKIRICKEVVVDYSRLIFMLELINFSRDKSKFVSVSKPHVLSRYMGNGSKTL
jgi:hypothetical protein